MSRHNQPAAARFVPRPAVALFLLLCGWYLLTMSGHTYTSDEETMLAVAESLVERGSFAIEPDFLMNYGTGSATDERYSRYGPGQSLLMVPFLLVGQAVATLTPDFADGLVIRLFVLLLPAIVAALTAVVLFAWVREAGHSVRVAVLVALLFGLTSLAWPYSRTLFSEPTATLFLVLCGYGIRRKDWRWWLVAGAAAGCALAVKHRQGWRSPVLALYALLVGWRESWPATLH
ncbi:MAG: hypothetical protein HC914_10615, partial [Chloroflexaceae bacterium]|nr:hypothetical protein [Chloroflexaceae bacterium]